MPRYKLMFGAKNFRKYFRPAVGKKAFKSVVQKRLFTPA